MRLEPKTFFNSIDPKEPPAVRVPTREEISSAKKMRRGPDAQEGPARALGLDPEDDRNSGAVSRWIDSHPVSRALNEAFYQVLHAFGGKPQSSEKATVAEGSLPNTWREAVPYVVWVVIVLGFGLEAVTALVHGEWLHLVVSAVGLVGLMAMALHWRQLQSWLSNTNPNWVWTAFALLLLGIILAPFIEQRRLPFAVTVSVGTPPTPTGRLWPTLTHDERTLLALALKILPKRDRFRVICVTSDCNALSEDFMASFHDASWNPLLATGNAFYREPYGIILYMKDINDRGVADAIEKTTSLKVDRIETSSDLTMESLFIGIRP
jgi:hypothetical protein